VTTSERPHWVDEELDLLSSQGLLRRRRVLMRSRPGRLVGDGREFIDFASNDYLGLAADPRIAEAVRAFLEAEGWGAGASPLVTGYHPIVERLEQELADFEGAESAILFSSGFNANVGVLSSLVGRDDVLFSERRNHASLIDGCRLSRSEVRLYDGRRLEELEEKLKATSRGRRRWLVTDSVFSMEGDVAPLVDLCDLAERYDVVLYVDESHATGVLGGSGRGLAEALALEHRIPLRMGTCSKALGSVGGFVVGDQSWIDLLVNRARPYIFSTASPPVFAAASLAALEILRREPWRRETLHRRADRLRQGLRECGFDPGASSTAIVPVIVGDAGAAIAISQELAQAGLWVGAIRPPSVPPGTSRLRLSVNAAHAEEDLDQLLAAIGKCAAKVSP
jgi:8-amino-7-oxononanoate synthase